MSVRIGAGLSAAADPRAGAREAGGQAAAKLGGRPADVAMVFAAGAHLAAPEATLEGVREALDDAAVLVGCGAGGVLGDGRELEAGTAVAVWAASLGGGEAQPFAAELTAEEGEATVEGVPHPEPGGALILLCDPYTFPADAVLAGLGAQAPGVPVLGGLSSARTMAGSAALFLGDDVREQGAVGLVLSGVELLPCVSQGATPLGREVTVTAAEGNVIQELAGRPAVETIEQVIGELSLAQRALVAGGLLVGLVIDGGKPDYGPGDFLVRGVLGADPATGAVAIGAPVSVGQVVRLHARDARSADEDLRRALRLRAEALGGRRPAGALVFSCNGRGRAMFGEVDHDARAVEGELRGAPAAGFFAAGEIGPVGGRSFLHGFTATIAVFAP